MSLNDLWDDPVLNLFDKSKVTELKKKKLYFVVHVKQWKP